MDIILGNARPHVCVFDASRRHIGHVDAGIGPSLTYISVPEFPADGLLGPDGSRLFVEDDAHPHGYAFDAGTAMPPAELLQHLARAIVLRNGVTHAPGMELILDIVHPDGHWAHHGADEKPTFVYASRPDVQHYLAEFYGCAEGLPVGVEDTYHTKGGPPGVSQPSVQANITQNGRDMQAALFGYRAGLSGTGTTAPGSTSITLDDQSAPGSTSQWNGQQIICGGVYGNIVSNTNASPPVLTIDRWNSFTSPGASSASTTPAAGKYEITQAPAPAQIMGLSSSSSALSSPSTNTSLPSEITTASGGLVRSICTIGHTPSANQTTEAHTFTANGSDTLPVTINSIGIFNSMVVSDSTFTMFFNTLLSTGAPLASVGDNVTVTDTITGT